MQRVRAVDGVATAAGGIQGDVTMRNAAGEEIGGATTFVLAQQPGPLDAFTFVAGRSPRAAGEVALSAKAFRDEGLKLGDTVTIVGDEGAQPFRLVGSATFGDVDTVAGYPGRGRHAADGAGAHRPPRRGRHDLDRRRGRRRCRRGCARASPPRCRPSASRCARAPRTPRSRRPTSRSTSASSARRCSSSAGSRCSSARSSSTTRSRSRWRSARASWRCCARSARAAGRCCARSSSRPA